jgi:cytochrome c biogenesis protein ResB
MPGASTPGGSVVVQMPLDREGKPYLWVSGIDSDNVMLEQDAPTRTPAGFTFTFGGRVEASGVTVRRDPGGTFIWIAVAMAMVGLGITFYVPRRRLWVKVTPARTYLAGIRRMGAELGARDALLPEDLERD